MTRPTAHVYLDTETHGLHRYAPIWEIGAIRREPDGTETEHHWFLLSPTDLPLAAPINMPEQFRSHDRTGRTVDLGRLRLLRDRRIERIDDLEGAFHLVRRFAHPHAQAGECSQGECDCRHEVEQSVDVEARHDPGADHAPVGPGPVSASVAPSARCAASNSSGSL